MQASWRSQTPETAPRRAHRSTSVRVLAACAAATCAGAPGCKRTIDPGPDVQVVGESTRVRLEDPLPRATPWFDGARVELVAARGELLGLQVLHRGAGPVALELDGPGVEVRAYAVEAYAVARPSTALYGGSRGTGTYADGLAPAPDGRPVTNPAYFEVVVAADAAPGARAGELVVGARRFPVALAIAPVRLPPLEPAVWAYQDPRELWWAEPAQPEPVSKRVVTDAERACVAVFRAHGVVLSPDLELDWWETRRELLGGFRHVPVKLAKDPARAADAVRGWIAATRGTGQLPFAIPIDEPRTPAAQADVRALAAAVRAAGGGPDVFRYAVTDAPRATYGDLIDLYISWNAAHLAGDRAPRWTYNGAPPSAGAVVLDAETPGTRTWGWIAWRWKIPVWYVWDALYWHDRHNVRANPARGPWPGRALDPRVDPISYDDGEDRGNLDGVLALPAPGGCRPTLRLAALRRGQQDRLLLDAAARCAPEATARLAADLVPRALGDAPRGSARSWPADEAAWERARRRLLELAACESPGGDVPEAAK